ncbi:hypothetical protein EGO55_10590 [Caenibius tardaugens NBRC 16725]|nr:hypothetical protein EGO55_10590 [Caenibius tardaugens NBRC 16725]
MATDLDDVIPVSRTCAIVVVWRQARGEALMENLFCKRFERAIISAVTLCDVADSVSKLAGLDCTVVVMGHWAAPGPREEGLYRSRRAYRPESRTHVSAGARDGRLGSASEFPA